VVAIKSQSKFAIHNPHPVVFWENIMSKLTARLETLIFLLPGIHTVEDSTLAAQQFPLEKVSFARRDYVRPGRRQQQQLLWAISTQQLLSAINLDQMS
jgi:hypothetical protein